MDTTEKHELLANSPHIINVDLDDFDTAVIDVSYRSPILMDLWAAWCAPCTVIAPVLEAFIEESGGDILLAKVDIDAGDNMKLAGRFRVRGFPTVILFERGQEVARFSGAQTLGYIRQFAYEYISML